MSRTPLRLLLTCVAEESEEIVVLYSARIYKWNKFTIKQERVLVVTNLNVYTFHKKSKWEQTYY